MAKDIVLSEKEVKKTAPFTTTLKTIKYLGINLTKEVKDLYAEDYKTWMKESKKMQINGKVSHIHGYGFSSNHVHMWELDQKEGWAPKYCCFQIVVLKTLESPLNSNEIKPVNSKGNQPWIFTGRTDAAAEAPVLWPPVAKSWLIRKDPDVGKEWRQEEKGTAEDENIGWHHRFNGHEFEQAPGVGDGQSSLACHSPWSHIESDMTERLNWSLCKERDSLYFYHFWT